jgi:hypothetical protein
VFTRDYCSTGLACERRFWVRERGEDVVGFEGGSVLSLGLGLGLGLGRGLGTVVGGLQVLHVLRPGVAFGNAVDPFTTHRPHSSGRSYREQQPCWSRMPVAFSVRVRVLLGEERRRAQDRETDSVRWMRRRGLAGAAMDARDLGVQASLAASQTLDRCAGMDEGSRRV